MAQQIFILKEEKKEKQRGSKSDSHFVFQSLSVPASQGLGDVTHASIGCLFGSTAQNDSLLCCPFGWDHNSSAFPLLKFPEQRHDCARLNKLVIFHKYTSQFTHLAVKDDYLLVTWLFTTEKARFSKYRFEHIMLVVLILLYSFLWRHVTKNCSKTYLILKKK